MVSPHGTHFISESTEAMQIKCLAQGHNILMQPALEPSIAVFRNQNLNHMTNMLINYTHECLAICYILVNLRIMVFFETIDQHMFQVMLTNIRWKVKKKFPLMQEIMTK